ncbi:TIGR02587 family membrane protein [Bauldia litoralis]|uniref:TIGR02587 family membrane protein n=1 Tax=Bauldia litoralis TaxID=665467 RepID=UPI003263B069
MMRAPERAFLVGLGRAGGGALLFAVPMLMTNEMWALGFSIHPLRLAVLLVLTPVLLFALAHYIGFRESPRLVDHLADALVAIAVAAFGAALFLFLFGLIGAGVAPGEAIGMVGLQVVPASMGAMLSRSQFGQESDREKSRRLSRPHYLGELFIMAVGALFLSLGIAPTQEVMDISRTMTAAHELALIAASLLIMHAFVYFVEFRGRVPVVRGASLRELFARFTVVGYAVVAMVSLFMLWTFGRLDGLGPGEIVNAVIVLSFPGAIGAAAARLVL